MNIFRSDKKIGCIILTAIPVFALSLLIYILSAQEGSVSDVTSGQVVNLLPSFVSDFFSQYFNLDELHAYLLIDSIIRTGAHFSEYALLGALSFLHFSRYIDRYKYIISFIFASLYSITDEIHQYFVPGRTCQLEDIITDSVGALCGLLFCFLLTLIVRKISLREKN